MNTEDVDLESHLGVDLSRLNEPVRTQLAEFVANRETRVAKLRERALDAEQEAEVLRGRVQSLQSEVEALEQRTAPDEAAGRPLDTESIVSTFGDALSSERITESGFTISDLSVNLRADVVNTEDGVRVTFPDLASQPAPERLSELSFSVRSDPASGERDLEEVPDLVGMTQTGAEEQLLEAGFDVGTIERVEADAESGRVVDQLPSPYSLAEPGAPVDLEIAEPADETIDLVGETFADVVRLAGEHFSLEDIRAVESPDPSGTVLDQNPEPGAAAVGDRLSLTISAYPEPGLPEETQSGTPEAEEVPEAVETDEAEYEMDAEEAKKRRTGASIADDIPESHTEEMMGDLEPLVERDVEEIHGIGDTYGGRLRNAGVESLADLAVAEPVRVADAANIPDDRAEDWVEAAREIARSLSEDYDGGEDV